MAHANEDTAGLALRWPLALLAAVSLAGCGTPGPAGFAAPVSRQAFEQTAENPVMITLTERDDGTHVHAAVGDMIELHLPENATTGYRWAIDRLDPHQLELAESSGRYPDSGEGTLVGAGGEAIFRFRVLTPAAATLALKQWRQWEGDKSIIRRFTITIEAGAAQ